MKKMLLTSLALAGMLTQVDALEWSQIDPRVPVAGKYTGTGIYVRKRSTGFTDTYANFFSGNGMDGSFFDGKYTQWAPKYVNGLQRLTYDGTMSTAINKLTVRLEGWSTLVSSDSRWEGHLYSAMMPINYNTGEYILHATNKPVDGNDRNGAKSTNNPYVFVENGDNLVIGNPNNRDYGLLFDWRASSYSNEQALESNVVVDVRGNLFANIKTQQDNTAHDRVTFNMKVTGNGMFNGTVDLNTRTSGTVPVIIGTDYASDFYSRWNSGAKNFHKIELTSSSGHLDGNAGRNDFLIGSRANTLFLTGGSYRGGKGLRIHAKDSAEVMVYNESNQLEIGSLSAASNAVVAVAHRENLTVDDLAFGTWDYNASVPGVISGNFTRNSTVVFDSRADLTINNFRGNQEKNGKVNVRLEDSKGGVKFNLMTNANNVHWRVGVNNGTTLNLHGTDNRFAEVWSKGNPNLKINHLGNDKTITGIENLWQRVVRDGSITVDMTARKSGKSDIFYINQLSDVQASTNGRAIKLIPKINTWEDRSKVKGEIIAYTPKMYMDVQKEILWNPGNGILEKGFKIVLGTFNQGNNHYGWKIDDYIMLGVDDVKPEPPKPDPQPPKPDPEPDPKPPVVDPEPTPPVEPPVDPKPPVVDPEPEKPNPPVNPPVEPEKPGGGETEKPVEPTPPTEGDGNKPVTPPDQGEGEKPVDPKPDPKPEEKPEQKPDTPVQPDQPVTPPSKPDVPSVPETPDTKPDVPSNPEDKPETEKPKPPVSGSVFTETFKRTMSEKVEVTKSLFLVNFNSINKRLGELRGNDKEHGVWTRAFVGGHDNSTFWTIQAGYDNQILKTEKYSFYLGAAGAFSKDDVTNMGEIALYASYIQNDGWYNDTIVKFAIMNSKAVVKDFMHYGVVFSDEVGYRFNINGFFIDPQVELSLGYLTGSDFKDVYTNPTNGASSLVNASFSDSIHFRTRFGASTGYSHVFEDRGIMLQGYVGLFGEVDKFTNSTGKVGAYGYNEIYGAAYTDDIRMVLNVGTNVDFRDAGRLYVDFEKSFLGDFNIDWKVNVGYRYAFGKKDVIKEDKRDDIVPVKLKDNGNEDLAKKEEPKAKPSKVEKVAKKDTAKGTKGKTKKSTKVAKKTSKSTKTAKVTTKKVETKKVARVEKKKSSGWFLK